MSDYGAYPYPSAASSPPEDRHPGPPPSTALASWAIALSIIPCGIGLILSVVFACMVLSRSRDGRDHGRGRAIAALVVVALWVAVIVLLIGLAALRGADRDASGTVVATGDVAVVDLRVGDCLRSPALGGGDGVVTKEVVPCTTPHRTEVYAVFDLEAPFTTPRDAERRSNGGCLSRFESFAGATVDDSGLAVVYYLPETADQFDLDPGVICLVEAPTEVTGTLRGHGPDPDRVTGRDRGDTDTQAAS